MDDSDLQTTTLYVRWPNGDKAKLYATNVTPKSHRALINEIRETLGPKPQCLLYVVS